MKYRYVVQDSVLYRLTHNQWNRLLMAGIHDPEAVSVRECGGQIVVSQVYDITNWDVADFKSQLEDK